MVLGGKRHSTYLGVRVVLSPYDTPHTPVSCRDNTMMRLGKPFRYSRLGRCDELPMVKLLPLVEA